MVEQTDKYGTDEELWIAFKQGDKKAYEHIFKAHYTLLFNYGLKSIPIKKK